MNRVVSFVIVPVLLPGLFGVVQAREQPVSLAAHKPSISIIIDDLGNRYKDGRRAVDLPGAITYSILPHLPFSKRLALHAHALSKEVMLHMPMEATNGNALGPGGLTRGMSERYFKNQVRENFESIPFARGYNNHMGSLLTQSTMMMRWLMQATMFRNDLYFVDSRTTRDSVALVEAAKRGIRSTRREIFLDYEQKPEIIKKQLAALVKRARRQGTALAIGHPYNATLSALEAWLPTLDAVGLQLVPVSTLIEIRQRRNTPWQMSSSR